MENSSPLENDSYKRNASNLILWEQFDDFYKQNPFEFQENQFQAIRQDIENDAHGLLNDEYVDFILWTKGLKSRQEYFAEFIEKLFSSAKYHSLLEIGCGRTARLARLLSTKGYEMTAIDPLLEQTSSIMKNTSVCFRTEQFAFGQTDISAFDAVVAQEPCGATEHIVRACIEKKKNFVISLCGKPHQLLNGTMLSDVYEWYLYLSKIDEEHCFLITSQYVPGFLAYVLIGIFS